MVGDGAWHAGQAGGDVAAESGVEGEAAVGAGEDELGVVLREHLEVHNLHPGASARVRHGGGDTSCLRQQMPLKLKRQLRQLVHLHLQRGGCEDEAGEPGRRRTCGG